MTEILLDPPPPSLPPPPPRLERDPDDKVVAGVCAAFGRHTGTDPVLWRVTVAVLAVFGGAGVALYGLGWLLVPRTGEPRSAAERMLRRPDRSLSVLGVLAVAVVGIVLLALLDNGAGAASLVVLAALAWLVVRERRERPLPPPPLLAHDEPPAPRRRERSPLGGLTLSAAAVVTGVLLLLRELGTDGLTAPRIVAAALLVVGAGLVVGTWWGRARWLLPLGLVLALLLAATATVGRVGVEGGVGERTWRAVDGGSYSLGAGEATLDLRGLRGSDSARVDAHVGFGELTVLVPRGMSVDVDADIRLGELRGAGVDGDDDGRISEQFVVGSADDVTVRLDLEVGLGAIEVRRVPS